MGSTKRRAWRPSRMCSNPRQVEAIHSYVISRGAGRLAAGVFAAATPQRYETPLPRRLLQASQATRKPPPQPYLRALLPGAVCKRQWHSLRLPPHPPEGRPPPLYPVPPRLRGFIALRQTFRQTPPQPFYLYIFLTPDPTACSPRFAPAPRNVSAGRRPSSTSAA